MIPNFMRDRYEGQMNPEERIALYNLVIETTPAVVCEVGTCRGGGTTYFIASALEENKKGILFTCENHKEFFDYAINLYSTDAEMNKLAPFIKFHFGDSLSVYPKIFCENKFEKIDFVVLDSAEDAALNVYDFCMFRPFIPVGGLLVMHDWDNGKTELIKPIINYDTDFKMRKLVIGLAIFERVSIKYN